MSLQRARWGKISLSLSLPFPSDSFYPWPLPTFSMSVGVAYFCAASWFCLVKSYPLPPAVTCCTSSAPSRRQYSLLMLYLEIYDPVSCRLSSCAKLFLGGGMGEIISKHLANGTECHEVRFRYGDINAFEDYITCPSTL